jgi:poly(3-hydroxybutyrate) depolymerase
MPTSRLQLRREFAIALLPHGGPRTISSDGERRCTDTRAQREVHVFTELRAMNGRVLAAGAVYSALSLAACSGSSSSLATLVSEDSVAPVAASGPSCDGIYGDPPRALTMSFSANFDLPFELLHLCAARGGEALTWTDPDGTPRQACLHIPAQAAREQPLPLVVFLQGSLFPADPQTFYNAWELLNSTADLTGDPNRPGFILLVPFGRDTQHFYPSPDDTGLGWDNWYRNLDRNDPAMNVDVAAIDHFIRVVKDRGIVDDRRVYMTGWSNGAAMAILYALNTPGIAATAVYSDPDPFADIDPCAQPPFGNNTRPIMQIHNDCDVIGICQTGGEGFAAKMAAVMPQVEFHSVIIDALQQETAQCNDLCAYDGNPVELLLPGTFRHVMWPYLWNDPMFEFLRRRPLP